MFFDEVKSICNVDLTIFFQETPWTIKLDGHAGFGNLYSVDLNFGNVHVYFLIFVPFAPYFVLKKLTKNRLPC